MALFSQFQTFFLSPFGEASVSDELNRFLRGHRIINVEKKMIDGERGTGWLFLVEYGQEQKSGIALLLIVPVATALLSAHRIGRGGYVAADYSGTQRVRSVSRVQLSDYGLREE